MHNPLMEDKQTEIPEEGMMFYEIEGEEKHSMWTVLSPLVANQKEEETILQKCWLSNEELKSFVEFEWEYEESHLRQLAPHQRGLPCELMSATWTEIAEEEFRWFLHCEETDGAKILQRSLTRLEMKNI
tara:strand:- start:907 stop:1293 length:387 start_codon:yes stop_codon:yes gene_type:complete